MRQFLVTVTLISLFAASTLFGITGEEILRKIDNNENFNTAIYKATMKIYVRGKMRSKSFTSYVKGDEKALTEFTAPSADKGIKYLKIGKSLWMYFPKQNDTVKISGHKLKQGFMGSDFSYEDALEADTVYKKYTITREGDVTYKGRECYIVTLTAKVSDAPYYKRKMWVDKSTFVVWKEEMSAKSGLLLKELHTHKVAKIGSVYFPMEVEMINKLKKGSKTVLIITDIDLNARISEDMFTQRALRK